MDSYFKDDKEHKIRTIIVGTNVVPLLESLEQFKSIDNQEDLNSKIIGNFRDIVVILNTRQDKDLIVGIFKEKP